MRTQTRRAEHVDCKECAAWGTESEASADYLAFATAKSFGDFVIAHSVLHAVEKPARARLRLISSSNVKGLNAVLPADVCVTLVDSEPERVPALFDLKKRGAVAAVRSAWSLRREFQKLERRNNETLVFAVFGARERFIAGGWPVIGPRVKGRNIYETYHHLLAERRFRIAAANPPMPRTGVRSLGIFSESRLTHKRLSAATLSIIFERAAAARLDATLFILDGDVAPAGKYPHVAHIPRDFNSLAEAIKSVDCVISADSLPAHLAEYFARPTFVALPAPNEYWMPFGCFIDKRWAVFSAPQMLCESLDGFLSGLHTPGIPRT